MLLPLFLICPCCKGPPSPRHFPLCEGCGTSLIPAGRLPIRLAPFHSVTALYYSIGTGHRLLKTWKKNRGTALNRSILHSGAHGALKQLPPVDCVLSIPQRSERIWELGGSPPEEIARFISNETGIPFARGLQAPLERTRPQAQKNRLERIASTLLFHLDPKWSSTLKGKRILLVDDFITTGRTLQCAGETLVRAGANEVHAFCLGYRPKRMPNRVKIENEHHAN